MAKNIVIAAPCVAVVFLCERIVHIENQRYALFLGMCGSPAADARLAFECLAQVQTRTSPLWHLYYALTD